MHWLLLALIAVAATANWWSRYRRDDRLEQVTKPLTTVLVIGLALVSPAPAAQVWAAVIALALCLVGDIALLPIIDRFVVGLGAFLVGHLAFLALFGQYGFDRWELGAIAVALMIVMAATVGRAVVAGAAGRDAALRIPVIAYLVVISAMTIGGWATGQVLVIVGSTLFVLSDSLLGRRQFVRSAPWMPVAVMATYHGALVALTLSLW